MTTPDPVYQFIDRVWETIVRYDLLPRRQSARQPAEPVIVGASGGPDSVALVHVLEHLRGGPDPVTGRKRPRRLAVDLVVAHLHHGLRGAEADRDARLAADLAARLHLPYREERADIRAEAEARGVGVEEAGREARRRFFLGVARDAGARRVALGHHGQDRIETVLFHILRGTGIDGLAALGPRAPLPSPSMEEGGRRGRPGEGEAPLTPFPSPTEGRGDQPIEIVRPMVHPYIGRRLVLAYLEQTGLSWRKDETNDDTAYTRNRLRHEVLPLLGRAVNPAVEEAIFRLADQAEAAQAVLGDVLDEVWRAIVREAPTSFEPDAEASGHVPRPRPPVRAILIDADDFAPLRPWLQGAILRRAVERLGGGLKHMSEARTREVLAALLSGTVAGPVDLPDGLAAERRRRVIRIGPKGEEGDEP